MAAASFAAVWGGVPEPSSLPPHQPDAQTGKERYISVPDTVNEAAEKRIQQEKAIPGGRGEGMHSYGLPVAENPEADVKP